jgi:hypothetical protein
MATKRTTAKKRKRTKEPASFSETVATDVAGRKRLPKVKQRARIASEERVGTIHERGAARLKTLVSGHSRLIRRVDIVIDDSNGSGRVSKS